MTDEEKTPDSPKPKKDPKPAEELTHVYIRSWPKAVLLYPLLGVSILFGLLSLGSDPAKSSGTMGLVFLLIFGVNLFVMTFDFSRAKSIALFFFVVAFIFAALFLGAKTDISVFAWVRTALGKVNAFANSSFYFGTAAILAILFIFMFIHTRLDYWELTRNELIHHHGILGDVERFPAPEVRFTKEINDIFEYGLLLSGTFVIYPKSEKRTIVLDTVPLIKRAEEKVNVLLSEIAVDINLD
jgi:hypothetical protein